MDPNGFQVAFRKGDVFAGRYAIERCIKAGGMGTVYEVRDTREGEARALKVILPRFASEPRYKKSFEREATLARTIRHPHVVRTYEAGVDDALALPFLVMELLHGEDLACLLRRGCLAPERALALLGEAASALDALHAVGIVHRDVKPANLFLAGDTLKVIDFGLAKLAFDAGDSRSTLAVGTPLFMAPEQIEGGVPITPACDRYALAQVAFCALVGRPFWEQDARQTDGVFPLLLRIAAGARDAASARARQAGVDLPPEFDDWFARATARSPHDRFGSASEMVGELAKMLAVSPRATTITASLPILHPDTSRVPPTGVRRGALRTAVAAFGVLGVAGGVLGISRVSTGVAGLPSAPRSYAGPVSSSELAAPAPVLDAGAEPATTEEAQGASSAAPPTSASSVQPKTASTTRVRVTRDANQDARVLVAPSSKPSHAPAPRALPSSAPARTPTVDSPW
jgi:serine/threonine-protein kinase